MMGIHDSCWAYPAHDVVEAETRASGEAVRARLESDERAVRDKPLAWRQARRHWQHMSKSSWNVTTSDTGIVGRRAVVDRVWTQCERQLAPRRPKCRFLKSAMREHMTPKVYGEWVQKHRARARVRKSEWMREREMPLKKKPRVLLRDFSKNTGRGLQDGTAHCATKMLEAVLRLATPDASSSSSSSAQPLPRKLFEHCASSSSSRQAAPAPRSTLLDDFSLRELESTCVRLAAKTEEREEDVPSLATLAGGCARVSDEAHARARECEVAVCTALDWRLDVVTACRALDALREVPELLIDAADEFKFARAAASVEQYACFLANMQLQSARFQKVEPVTLAAAIALAARELLGVRPRWPARLRQFTSLDERALSELADDLLEHYSEEFPEHVQSFQVFHEQSSPKNVADSILDRHDHHDRKRYAHSANSILDLDYGVSSASSSGASSPVQQQGINSCHSSSSVGSAPSDDGSDTDAMEF